MWSGRRTVVNLRPRFCPRVHIQGRKARQIPNWRGIQTMPPLEGGWSHLGLLSCNPSPSSWSLVTSSERIWMLEFGKAGNAFCPFQGTIRKTPVLFLCFKTQEWAKPTYWGNCKQPRLCLKYTSEVSWTTAQICVLYTCQSFKAGLHYIVSYSESFLRLKWKLWISKQIRNKPQFNIQCKDRDGSLIFANGTSTGINRLITSICKLELWF